MSFNQIMAEIRDYIYKTTKMYTKDGDIKHALGNVIALERELYKAIAKDKLTLMTLSNTMNFAQIQELLKYKPVSVVLNCKKLSRFKKHFYREFPKWILPKSL